LKKREIKTTATLWCCSRKSKAFCRLWGSCRKSFSTAICRRDNVDIFRWCLCLENRNCRETERSGYGIAFDGLERASKRNFHSEDRNWSDVTYCHSIRESTASSFSGRSIDSKCCHTSYDSLLMKFGASAFSFGRISFSLGERRFIRSRIFQGSQMSVSWRPSVPSFIQWQFSTIKDDENSVLTILVGIAFPRRRVCEWHRHIVWELWKWMS
jgi:hypothetical protein